MPYTAPTPSTVAPGDTFPATAYNIIAGDLADHESRINSYSGVFVNEAARDAAIPSPAEGMRAYLTVPTIPTATGSLTSVPTGVETVYNGSVWVCLTEVASTSVTSTTTSISSVYAAAWTSGSGDTITNSVTLVTGTTALVHLGLLGLNNGTNSTLFPAVAVSGATTQAASEVYSVGGGIILASTVGGAHGTVVLTGLTAGTNTFTLNVANASGSASWNIRRRFISVRGIA